jgi:hypothetical protein
LGISTSLGALIRVIALVGAAIVGYASLRGDLNAAVDQGKRNSIEIGLAQDKLDTARMDLRGLDAKFDEFMRSYNRDMNRYIRTDNDRR